MSDSKQAVGSSIISEFASLANALVPLAWPILVAVVVWKLFPLIRLVIESRSFNLKIAGMEIGVQEAAESIGVSIADLQQKVIELQNKIGPSDGGLHEPVKPQNTDASRLETEANPLVLWVDDKPSNNAFEIERLTDQGIEVVTAMSTEDAMAKLSREKFSVVLSDMGRREGGVYRAKAGLLLLKLMRENGYDQPFFVYTSRRHEAENNEAVLINGGSGATASTVDLFQWLQQKIVFSQSNI